MTNPFRTEKGISSLGASWVPASSVVVGDVIRFEEGVFGGSYRKPSFLGTRKIKALVLRESYGEKKQQHTFTIRILDSSGYDPLSKKKEVRRKGRNIYRHGVERMLWKPSKRDPERTEDLRREVAEEKHTRGGRAREVRRSRREEPWKW